MLKIFILFIIFSQNEVKNHNLQIQHHYELLNYDKTVLIELQNLRKTYSLNRLNRPKRNLNENQIKQFKDDYFVLNKDNFIHSILSKNKTFVSNKSKIDDDDFFKQRKLDKLNKFKIHTDNLDKKYLKLSFNAHNREFKINLKLKHLNNVFAPNVQFESTNRGLFNYDVNNIINGFLEDEKESEFEGIITHDGLIDGIIKSSKNDEEFYIEPAREYMKKINLNERNKNKTNFHSIIYKLSDIKLNNFTCRNYFLEQYFKKNPLSVKLPIQNVSNYFSINLQNIKQKLNELNNKKSIKLDYHYLDELDEYIHHNFKRSLNTSLDSNLMLFTDKNVGKNYVPLNHQNSNLFEQNYLNNKYSYTNRKHRFTKLNQFNHEPIKKLNKLFLNNDSKYFWKEIDNLHYNSEAYGVRAIQRTHWTSDIEDSHLVVDSRKTTCMLYLLADHYFYKRFDESEEACIEIMIRHIQKVNSIYRVTDFDQDGRSDNISFLIKRIKVYTTDALKDPDYKFSANYSVERFLELFSEEDYDAFCLAYMFTYRDFEGGTLGLAWTGDLKNAGGVCEKNGHYRGSLKSLNTGIITLLNYGKHVPPIVSHVTLAHEIGHSCGSPHDPEDDGMCTPGGEDGNYIMFAKATSGDKKNNNLFSPCSLKSVNAVLNTKGRSLKGCFQQPQEAICGNEVVELDEECDCGWEEDCTESCCFPMQPNPPPNETPCKLRPGIICSPSQGPCCTQECKLKIGNQCRDDNGCRTASYCNGQGSQCPLSINKPNKTICNKEFVCYMGECTGSICTAYGLESCQCKRKIGDPETKLCELCCRMPGDDSTCKSSFEWNMVPFDVPDLFSKPGTPCDNYNGYCDILQTCQKVYSSGTFASIRRFLFSDRSVAIIYDWVQRQWLFSSLICLMVVFLCYLLLRIIKKATIHEKNQRKIPSKIINTNNLIDNNLNPSNTSYTVSGNTENVNTYISNNMIDTSCENYNLRTNLNLTHLYQLNKQILNLNNNQPFINMNDSDCIDSIVMNKQNDINLSKMNLNLSQPLKMNQNNKQPSSISSSYKNNLNLNYTSFPSSSNSLSNDYLIKKKDQLTDNKKLTKNLFLSTQLPDIKTYSKNYVDFTKTNIPNYFDKSANILQNSNSILSTHNYDYHEQPYLQLEQHHFNQNDLNNIATKYNPYSLSSNNEWV